MSNEVQKSNDTQLKSYSENTGMVETVRKTIFPNATNDEMQLYFYQCVVSGVHPLSKKIIPVKFNDKVGGGSKISFITTVDHARSKAEESGKYDGQDEPIYEGIILENTDNGEIEVPEIAKVNVYKSGISRPFVGIARWVEFFPGKSRGAKYLQMPYHMLAKCAEMQAMRKAFPDQLHNLYTEEEMLNVMEGMANTSATNSRPNVTENDVTIEENSSDNGMPTEEQRKSMKLISEAQGKRLFAICKSKGVKPEAICAWAGIRSLYWMTWSEQTTKNYKYVEKAVQDKPEFFSKYDPKAAPKKEPVESVQDVGDFEKTCIGLAQLAGHDKEKAEFMLDMEFSFKKFSDVPADQQTKVIDWLNSLQDTAGA